MKTMGSIASSSMKRIAIGEKVGTCSVSEMLPEQEFRYTESTFSDSGRAHVWQSRIFSCASCS